MKSGLIVAADGWRVQLSVQKYCLLRVAGTQSRIISLNASGALLPAMHQSYQSGKVACCSLRTQKPESEVCADILKFLFLTDSVFSLVTSFLLLRVGRGGGGGWN